MNWHKLILQPRWQFSGPGNTQFNWYLPNFPSTIVQLRNFTFFIERDKGEFVALSHLDLSRNNVESLPDSLFGLTNLSELILSRNKITFLPPQIERLAKLVCLKVGASVSSFWT